MGADKTRRSPPCYAQCSGSQPPTGQLTCYVLALYRPSVASEGFFDQQTGAWPLWPA